MATVPVEEEECLNAGDGSECSEMYDCCRCGGNKCGCAYCFDCNACHVCKGEEEDDD